MKVGQGRDVCAFEAMEELVATLRSQLEAKENAEKEAKAELEVASGSELPDWHRVCLRCSIGLQ